MPRRWPACERRPAARSGAGPAGGQDQARRDAQRARQQARDAAAAAGQRRAGRRPGDEPRANRACTELRANTTDPDCGRCATRKATWPAYNGQLVVTCQQVIVARCRPSIPSTAPCDPLLDTCRQQLTRGRD